MDKIFLIIEQDNRQKGSIIRNFRSGDELAQLF
ncbi:MAG: hypothetical protein RL628_1051 [Actinomycetota bacterium]